MLRTSRFVVMSLSFAVLVSSMSSCSKTSPPPVVIPDEPLVPAKVLDLTNWKLNIPIDASGGFTGVSKEISQPELNTFSLKPYFYASPDGGVVFRAHTGGATTSGSNYPRTELREMKNNGMATASWSSGSGVHMMEIEQAVTNLPSGKPHIVVGQIHGGSTNTGPDGNDDIIVFRLEGSTLFVDHNGTKGATITTGYVLGTRFKVKFEVSSNQVKSYYNDQLVETYPRTFSSAYFKAGAYVQASCTYNSAVTDCNTFGQVIIYNATVSHQ